MFYRNMNREWRCIVYAHVEKEQFELEVTYSVHLAYLIAPESIVECMFMASRTKSNVPTFSPFKDNNAFIEYTRIYSC